MMLGSKESQSKARVALAAAAGADAINENSIDVSRASITTRSVDVLVDTPRESKGEDPMEGVHVDGECRRVSMSWDAEGAQPPPPATTLSLALAPAPPEPPPSPPRRHRFRLTTGSPLAW